MANNYSKILGIATDYDDEQLDALRTYRVDTIDQLEDVLILIKNYSYVPIQTKFLKGLIFKPRIGLVEVLYGPAGKGQQGYCPIEPKAAVVFVSMKKELILARFAIEPWFEEELAINWAEYRIEKAKKHYDKETIAWLVDENNLHLQLSLKKREYLASVEPGLERLIKFIK